MKFKLITTLSVSASLLITSLTAQVFTTYTEADGLIDNNVNCLAIDGNGHVWFGTQNGISKFDGNNWSSFDTASHPGLPGDVIKAITANSDGSIWVGTDVGAGVYNGSSWTSYTESDGLADDRIKHIKEDADGNTWFGNNDGVSVFDGTNWTSYTTADGLPFGGVNFISFSENGDYWFGTGLGGVAIFDGSNFSEITESDGLLNDKVKSIAIDENDYKWVGTSDGISVFDHANQHSAHHTRPFILPAPDTLNPIVDVQVDSRGYIWAGVYIDYLVTEGGVSMFTGWEWIQFDTVDGLAGPVIRRLAIDNDDNVWVATSSGVTKISNTPTGVASVKSGYDFQVYPNPNMGTFNLVFQGYENNEYCVIIRNRIGQKIYTTELPDRKGVEKQTFDLSDQPDGMYLITVKLGEELLVKKVILMR